MTYTANQLRSALIAEHQFALHDDCTLPSVSEYTEHIMPMSLAELIHETCTDSGYTLDEFMSDWL